MLFDELMTRPATRTDAPAIAQIYNQGVFHFLVEETERRAYLTALNIGLRRGGSVVLATFSPTGPERCSGLPVRRDSAETLSAELGPDFELLMSAEETHRTPAGGAQSFTWCLFRRTVGG